MADESLGSFPVHRVKLDKECVDANAWFDVAGKTVVVTGGSRGIGRMIAGASKAAVHMLTRKLAATLAPDQITVNAIAPGPFPSKMTAHALDDPERPRAGAYLIGAVIPVDGGVSGAR